VVAVRRGLRAYGTGDSLRIGSSKKVSLQREEGDEVGESQERKSTLGSKLEKGETDQRHTEDGDSRENHSNRNQGGKRGANGSPERGRKKKIDRPEKGKSGEKKRLQALRGILP